MSHPAQGSRVPISDGHTKTRMYDAYQYYLTPINQCTNLCELCTSESNPGPLAWVANVQSLSYNNRTTHQHAFTILYTYYTGGTEMPQLYIWQLLRNSLHIVGFWWLIPGAAQCATEAFNFMYSTTYAEGVVMAFVCLVVFQFSGRTLLAQVGYPEFESRQVQPYLILSLFLSAFWLFKLYYSTVESFGTVKHCKFIHVHAGDCL